MILRSNDLGNQARIWHTHRTIFGWLPCKIWSPPSNPFPRYKSRILVDCALATSVEKDAIGEDKAFAHVGRILHTHNDMLGWLACKIWSPKDDQFLRYNWWILAHFTLSSSVEKDAIGDDKALPTWVKFDTHAMLGTSLQTRKPNRRSISEIQASNLYTFDFVNGCGYWC